MRRLLEYGGYAAAVVLVAFGIGALVLSIQGKNTVKDSLSAEAIVGSDDMAATVSVAVVERRASARVGPLTADELPRFAHLYRTRSHVKLLSQLAKCQMNLSQATPSTHARLEDRPEARRQ